MTAAGSTPPPNPISVPTPSAPPASPPPTTAFAPQFRFADDVSAVDRQLIERGIALAQDFFVNRFGFGLTGNTVIEAAATTCGFGGGTFGANLIKFCTTDPSWPSGSIQNTKTVVHEMFHLMERQYVWPTDFWKWEGAAEYVGYNAVISAGMVTYQEVLGCQTFLYDQRGRELLPLAQRGSLPYYVRGTARRGVSHDGWSRDIRGSRRSRSFLVFIGGGRKGR